MALDTGKGHAQLEWDDARLEAALKELKDMHIQVSGRSSGAHGDEHG